MINNDKVANLLLLEWILHDRFLGCQNKVLVSASSCFSNASPIQCINVHSSAAACSDWSLSTEQLQHVLLSKIYPAVLKPLVQNEVFSI